MTQAGLIRRCPCGTGLAYDGCCGRLHRGAAQADSPEALMRARYAAYAVGDLDYVFRTWHPRTRPAALDPDPALTWTGLEVLATGGGTDGATGSENGEVEFVATYRRAGVVGELRERSRFERRRGRWVYVEGRVG